MVAAVASEDPQIAPKAAQPPMVASREPAAPMPQPGARARNSARFSPPLVAKSPISRNSGMTDSV